MREGGFTLVEMMVVLAVIGILATVVIPSFQTFYYNGVGTTQVNEFVTSLNYARSEAITRGTQAIMCKSNDGASCDNALNWHEGWLIFADTNNSSTLDNTDVILRVHGPLTDSNSTLYGNGTVTNTVTFNASGTSQNGSFLLCDDRGLGEHAKAIVLSFGRIRTLKQTDPSVPDSVKNATSCQF